MMKQRIFAKFNEITNYGFVFNALEGAQDFIKEISSVLKEKSFISLYDCIEIQNKINKIDRNPDEIKIVSTFASELIDLNSETSFQYGWTDLNEEDLLNSIKKDLIIMNDSNNYYHYKVYLYGFCKINEENTFDNIYDETYDQYKEVITDVINDIKDSGNRTEFESGAVRDRGKGKGRFDLLPARAVIRLARHFEKGALKYEDRNWEKGIPISSFIDSALRHIFKYMDGQVDEDHLCAAAWNILCAMWTEEKHDNLIDLPERMEIS